MNSCNIFKIVFRLLIVLGYWLFPEFAETGNTQDIQLPTTQSRTEKGVLSRQAQLIKKTEALQMLNITGFQNISPIG